MKPFWWFSYADTKDTVFVWFHFFYFFELFPAFICANDIGSLVNNSFGVEIFNPFPYFTYSSPAPSSGMSDSSSFADHTL